MRINEPIAQFNTAIEEKTLAEVDKDPLPLPESYHWSVLNMEDPQEA